MTIINDKLYSQWWHSPVIEKLKLSTPNREIARDVFGNSSFESRIRRFLERADVVKEVGSINQNKIDTLRTPAKVGFLDIECTYNYGGHFQNYGQNIHLDQKLRDSHLLSYAYAWNNDEPVGEVLKADVIQKDFIRSIVERDPFTKIDYDLTLKLWHFLDNADVVVGQNCLEVSTPVLKADLTWCPVGELKVGDKLAGFEEGVSPFKTRRDENGNWNGQKGRSVLECEVTENTIVEKEAFEVLLSNGDKIVTTDDHYWLGRARKCENHCWYKTSELVGKGIRLHKYMNVWSKPDTYNQGWLSGFIAGEGSLKKTSKGVPSAIQICQRPTSTWDKCLSILDSEGVKYSKPVVREGGYDGSRDVEYLDTQGGKWKTLEIIGRYDIGRLKEKIDFNNFGKLGGQNKEEVTVVSVKPVGVKKIAIMGTSSSTYFGAGYPMHNCKAFDIKKINGYFLKYDLPLPSPYKVYDTLSVAKKMFNISFKSLKFLAKYLGVTQKLDNSGAELWMDCSIGYSDEALQTMLEYNIGDIITLREVYLKMIKYGNDNVNMALYEACTEASCPTCGSTDVKPLNKTTNTQKRVYEVYRCNNCSSLMRDNIAVNETNKFSVII